MEEIVKQLSRIADALEAQNAWGDKWLLIQQQQHKENRGSEARWLEWNKQIRDEDLRNHLREQQLRMKQEVRAFDQALIMTEAFAKDHPELIKDIIQIEQAPGKDEDE